MRRPRESPSRPVTGLALCGGGIRSATFGLGILRALGRAGLIDKIDYLSTVSGGSYIGAFFCAMFARPDGASSAGAIDYSPADASDPFDSAIGKHALRHVRESGRYLTTGALGDLITIFGIGLRNWLGVHVVIGLSILTMFLVAHSVQASIRWATLQYGDLGSGPRPWLWVGEWAAGMPVGHWLTLSPFLPLALPFFAYAFMCGWAYWLTQRDRGPDKTPRTSRVSRLWSRAVAASTTTLALGIWIAIARPFTPQLQVAAVATAAVSATGMISYLVAQYADKFDPENKRSAVMILVHPITAVLKRLLDRKWSSKSDPKNKRRAFMITFGKIAPAWKQELNEQGNREPPVAGEVNKGPISAGKVNSACDLNLQEDRIRVRLSEQMAAGLRSSLFIAALAVVDTLAQSLYVNWDELRLGAITGGVTFVAIAALARGQLATLIRSTGTGPGVIAWIERNDKPVTLVVGLILAFGIAMFWATLSHVIAWRGRPPGEVDTETLCRLLPLTVGLAILSALIGQVFSFLNLSTFSSYYAARLRRAYLAASNMARGTQGEDANQDHPKDDLSFEEYYKGGVLAPLHLLNITINDTYGKSSNVVRRDRHGRPFCVSPVGMLYQSGRDPADIELIEHNACAPLPMSVWTAISGAAFSTGVGQFASLGRSLLASLVNFRLGYWWHSGVTAKESSFAVQHYLAHEMFGSFPGTDRRRWNLSDGGHFENSGVYELIRRRVPFIIMIDSGEDRRGESENLVTLLRRIRIDFGTAVKFLAADDLDSLLGRTSRLRKQFTSLSGLGLTEASPQVGPYAALAKIDYGDPRYATDAREGRLLLLKPRICGGEDPDLRIYAEMNKSFPYQSFFNQFFDEAQWESYFRLGESIGTNVFAPNPNDSPFYWQPRSMQ